MAVEVRYHVVRKGKEVAMYATKKEADAHDKMLDIAENLFAFIQASDTVTLEEEQLDELALYLAQNRDALARILKGGNPVKAPATTESTRPPQKATPKKTKAKAKAKAA